MAALAKPPAWLAGAQRLPSVDRTLARAIVKAVSESGIRPSHRSRRVSDYELRGLLAEGDGWQDFEGVHVSAGVQRRIRIYPFASGSGEQATASGRRCANSRSWRASPIRASCGCTTSRRPSSAPP